MLIVLDDATEYKRVTVQLHGRGVIERDRVLGAAVKTKDQQLVKARDFLVAEIDAKMGAFGIVPPTLEGSIVSSHYFTFEIAEDLLLPEWLEAIVRLGWRTEEVMASVRGSLNYAAIRPRHVSAARFPFAPLPVQHQVVDQLRAVEQLRQAAEAQLAAVDGLSAAILRRAFSGEP